jgi:UDP-2-acetamido-3-amino-2,3-dideoxy-glucuronate N-acetyltransferase
MRRAGPGAIGMSDSDSPPRVAVSGCGYWGSNLVRVFDQLGALGAVQDPDPVALSAMTEAHRVPAREWDDLLADPAIDAVAIAAPAACHGALSHQALSAGKHVFVEKPLSLSVEEAEGLCDLADDTGNVLMVGHLLQYHPAFRRLLELVSEGALGRVQYLYSNRLNLGRFRQQESILWSFAPHDISMILALVGAEPTRVDAVGRSFLQHRVADVTTTHLAFPGGEQAHVFVSWLHPFKEQKLVVVGDRAMAVFDDGEPWDSKLGLYDHHVDWRSGTPEPVRAEAKPVAVKPGEPLEAELRHFLECVVTGTRPRTDGPEAVRVLRVLHAAEQSLGVTQSVPASTRLPGVMVDDTAVIDDEVEIGPGTRIWHFSHVLAGSRIGRDCSVGQNVMIGPNVEIGDRCKIQNNVSVYEGVTLADGVFCGPGCVFTNVLTPRAEIDRREEFGPTHVARHASIGANATILCGNDIGEYALVGAGAVVSRDVPPFALVVGSPARRVGWVGHAGEPLGADLVCPRTGRRYREAGPDRLEEVTT